MTTITIKTVATVINTNEVITVIGKSNGWTRCMDAAGNKVNHRAKDLTNMHNVEVINSEKLMPSMDGMVINEHVVAKALVYSVPSMLASRIALNPKFADVGVRSGLIGYILFQTMKLFNQFPAGDMVAIDTFADVATRKVNAIVKMQNQDGLWMDFAPGLNYVDALIELNLIKIKGVFVAPTKVWYDMIGSVSGAALPATKPIEDADRLRGEIKGGKVRVCADAKERLRELASTSYHVCPWMLSTYEEMVNSAETITYTEVKKDEDGNVVNTREVTKPIHAWEAIKSAKFVIEGCKTMIDFPELYSEWFYDMRGRSYFLRCAGPNPQSSDIARAMYSHNIENIVKKGSPAYWIFIAEMRDLIGSIDQCKDKKANNAEWVFANRTFFEKIAHNSAAYMRRMFKNAELNAVHSIDPDWVDLDTADKPATFTRMCIEFMAFEINGEHDCRMSFGLDAKNSGAQYIGFIAGCSKMAKATGLTDSPVKADDPYMNAANTLNTMLVACEDKKICGLGGDFFTRNGVKRPFMAVQYSGTWKALFNTSEFTDQFVKRGFLDKDLENVCKFTVNGILNSFGSVIKSWMDEVKDGVEKTLDGKAFLTYYHTDGFKVTNPVYNSVKIGEVPFKVRIDDSHGEKRYIDFGSFENGTPWEIEQHTVADAEEYVRTFIVHYIQGIDALIARTITKHANKAGLRGFTAIHDCFRCCLADAPKMKAVIAAAYKEVFIDEDGGNKQLRHLMNTILKGNMTYVDRQVVTEELLDSEHSYYFC